MVPFEETSYYTTPITAGPTLSLISVAAVGLVGFLSLLLVAIGLLREAAMRARAAKAAVTDAEKRRLEPGYAILHGQVETGDALPAVSVRIRQVGRQYSGKQGLRHVWTEIERQIDARPFFLRLASGERVKVVPANDVFLVDVLGVESDGVELPMGLGPPKRVHTAQLSNPDFAYACGRLTPPVAASAYRSAEDGYSLHPWRGKMLLSAEPLEARYVRRARFHLGWVLACVAALLFTNGILFGGYWLELVWGRPVTAQTCSVRTWTTRGKHGPIRHYGVVAIATLDDQPITLTSETSYAVYVHLGPPAAVPFLVVPFHPKTHDIGTQPTLNAFICAVAFLVLLVVAGGYFLHTRHTRPWYERKKVVDVGKGPLGSPDALA